MRADDVYAARLERIGCAYHGSDVEVVRPVFHGDFEIVAATGIQIGLNGRDRPIAVSIEHVAAVAFVKQCGIEAGIIIRG